MTTTMRNQHHATTVACQYPTCALPAILMPGYKRACAQHIAHILYDTLTEYNKSREAGNISRADDKEHIDRLISVLHAYIACL